MPNVARITAPLPLLSPRVFARQDINSLLSSEESATSWRCVLTGAADGLPDLVLRISSWQATIQTGRANYIQCVAPASLDTVAEIAARRQGEIVIARIARLANGQHVEREMVRSRYSNLYLNEGPRRRSVVLNGWSPALTEAVGSADLYGVQTISDSDGGLRVRAAIDWSLRPGMTARFMGREMAVAFINYYVGTDRNTLTGFMDVGSRADG